MGTSDTDLAAYVESIELALASLYGLIGGLLGDLRPAGDLFASHHNGHAAAFGALAGEAATHRASNALLVAVTPRLQAMRTRTDALELAFVMENQMVATHAFALKALSAADAITAVASILPVESEHAAILGLALGKSGADLFPNGSVDPASVGEVGNPATGLDPARYPAG